MRINIETERLIIRNMDMEDYRAIFTWCGDPVVNEYMIYTVYQKAEDLIPWIAGHDPEAPNACELVFVLKETGTVIGGGGINLTEESGVWEIGYNLAREYWGHGYVPEAMQAVVDYVRTIREVKAIVGEFCVENAKSGRVMEKLGMSFYADAEYTKMDGSRVFKSKRYRREF